MLFVNPIFKFVFNTGIIKYIIKNIQICARFRVLATIVCLFVYLICSCYILQNFSLYKLEQIIILLSTQYRQVLDFYIIFNENVI